MATASTSGQGTTVSTTPLPSIGISGITVTLNRLAKGAPSLKLIINGETKLKRSFDHNLLNLRWEFKPAFVLKQKSVLTIRLDEHPMLRSKVVAEESISFDDAQRLLSASDECKDHKLRDDPIITIDLEASKPLDPTTLASAAEVLGEYKPILDRLGRSRKFLETLLGLGTAVSELDPTAKAVLACVNVLYKRLEEGNLRHKSLVGLIENLSCTIGYVEDVEQFARLKELKRSIEEVRPLVDDTTNFVLKYSSGGELTKVTNSFLSSSDQDQIEKLTGRFEQFKLRFDRGVSIQSAVTAGTLLTIIKSNQDDAVIAKLKPTNLEYGSQVSECMEGTRLDILNEINRWVDDIDAPNIFWLKGHPGAGKSAIASSAVEQLRGSSRLGSSFFFQRERADAMTPKSLWRAVAYDLGRQYPTIRKRLVATLNDEETVPSTVNIDKLFRQLIHDPLVGTEDIPIGRLPVIVIDALDECGGLDGQHSEHRLNLLRSLKSWSQLPRKFKLLVTARGESDIEQLFSTTNHHLFEVFVGQKVDPKSEEDIKTFLRLRFRRIAARFPKSLPSDWPGDQVVVELGSKAAGLFIWVDTVANFVNRGDPEEQLGLILDGGGTGDIAELYSLILKTSFPDPSEAVINSFHSILGAVILAKAPLPTASLIYLLSLKATMMEYICDGLQSVMESQTTPRIHHQSFVDFLVDQKRCPSTFLIDRKRENRILTIACLQTMNDNLRFNICELESSHLRNDDIRDLASRVKERIPLHLSYSSYHWASHLIETTFDPEIWDYVQTFMKDQFLYWLEVLSLTKCVNLASSILWLLVEWSQAGFQDDTLARDLQKFVATFGSVIAQSAPHIYLSALPFSPRKSALSKQYMEKYPQTLAIQRGGQSSWPATQNVLFGHTGLVSSVAFSPDGRRIASGSWDHTLRMWDAETGEVVLGPLIGHADRIASVIFSPDGRWVASGSRDGTIRIWDAQTGEAIAGPFIGHERWINSVVFSQDGRWIASGSEDKTIRIWDVQTGEAVTAPLIGPSSVDSVSFSSDGKQIASGSWDRKIRIWDIQTGEIVTVPLKAPRATHCIGFSPDGRLVASGSQDNAIRIWDAQTGEAIAGPLIGHERWTNSVVFSPDSRWIASGSGDKTIRIWDVQTGELVTTPLTGPSSVDSIAFSPDGRRIASGSKDNTIRIWDAQTGEVATEPLKGHEGRIFSVAFSPDGRRFTSASEDYAILVWDAETGEVVAGPLVGHHFIVLSVMYSPDGRWITTFSADNTIRIWDIETCEGVAGPLLAQKEGMAFAATFSPDGRWIAAGSEGPNVWIGDAQTGEGVIGSFARDEGEVRSVAFSPDGKRVASGSRNQSIRIWDAETGKGVVGPLTGHDDCVYSVAFSPDGRWIASGSDDKTIRIWNVETGEVAIGPLSGHKGPVRSVVFSPDGRWIASGSEDKTIRIWDVETGEVAVGPLSGHEGRVHSVAFSSDGRRIVSGSADRTVRAWDMQNEDSTNLETKLASFPDNSRIVNGWVIGANSELLFWVPPELRAGFCWARGIYVAGKVVTTKLDLRSFVHGESWSLCNKLV